MLRISDLPKRRGVATLRFEGRLVGPWVSEACQYCERTLRRSASLRLDLADLYYLDRTGALLLAQLRARGVVLLNPSPFVEEQLKSAGED